MSIERVAFEVAGDRIVGELRRPDGPGPHPAAITAGPMTSVKEQVTGVYAAALAQRGIAALAIDHRGFGESGGAPRQYEHHARKVEDLRAGLDFLTRTPGIDGARLGAAAICLGSGYAAHLAASDKRVKAAGFVAGYYRDPAAMRARDAADFDAKVAQGRDARLHFEATGEVLTIPAAARDGDAAMQTDDTIDYYTRRAAVPNYTNAFALMSREVFLPFDVQSAAPNIAIPVAMVHSERALSPAWARQFHAGLAGPKSIEWLTSDAQTDFYDNPALVSAAVDRIAAHLRAHLG
jgi:hypothetical protein